jgi:uncharacterized heparinase superfamily protein
MTGATKLWHTVRWLRPSQVLWRIWFKLHRPVARVFAAPATRTGTGWMPCPRTSSQTAADSLRFLGIERRLQVAADWQRPDWPRLWLYNAHYFDDLVADDAAARGAWHRQLVTRWIAENSPGHGAGWEPYPTSLRIVNWTKWAWSGNALESAALQSLATQTRWLRRHLEFHLLGNHLWANAKALVFAGTFFAGDEADAWRSQGLALVERELAEQILADGGHFERSPMYQAIVLEDLLDLLQLATRFPELFDPGSVAGWRATAARMQRWLWTMSHPDGGVAFFNDAALDIAPTAAALAVYAESLGLETPAPGEEPLQTLPASGYVRLQAGLAMVLVDVGEIGPDYLPGHAHADTLAFEWSLDGHRLCVNAGISTYAADAERLRQRGTGAHNTVQVDAADSSEVWSSFRVARRARPFDVAWGEGDQRAWVRAAHDGYRRLPGRVVHRRELALGPRQLVIEDVLTGHFESAVARFRLHPDWTCDTHDGASGIIAGHGRRVEWRISGGTARVIDDAWHPGFGQTLACRVLEVDIEGDRVRSTFAWE